MTRFPDRFFDGDSHYGEGCTSSPGARQNAHMLRWLGFAIAIGICCSLALGVSASPPTAYGPSVSERGSDQARVLSAGQWELLSPSGWVGRPTIVSARVTDGDGLGAGMPRYQISMNTGASWSEWAPVDTANVPITTTSRMTVTIASFADSGTANQIRFSVTDTLTVTEVSPVYVIQVDGTAPASPQDLKAVPSGWTGANGFQLTWGNPIDLSGVIKAYYKIGSPPSGPADTTGSVVGVEVQQIDSLLAPTMGEVSVYVWLEDAAGNASYNTHSSVRLFYAGPTPPGPPVGIDVDPGDWTGICAYSVSWSNPTVPSTVNAAWYKWGDPPSGPADGTRVAGTDIETLTALNAPGEGEHTLSVWLEDGAGQQDPLTRSTVTARCDTTPPTTDHALTPPLPTGGWYNGPTSVSLAAADALSGVENTWWRRGAALWKPGTEFVAGETGTTVYEYRSRDRAGNVEDAKQVQVRVDRQPPVSLHTPSPPVPTSGWYRDTVTVAITATDDLSGWSGQSWYRIDDGTWHRGTQATISDDGAHQITFYSSDIAGNIESATVAPDQYKIDRTPPVLTATPEKTAPFVQPPVAINLQASDTQPGVQASGVSRIEYRRQGSSIWIVGERIRIDGSEGDGVYVYECRARDLAGNVSAPITTSLRVDGTPPLQPAELAATPGSWVNQNGSFGLNWENPSDYSGIVGVYYQFDTDPISSLNPVFVPGDEITTLSGLTVSGEGRHSIYIWLKDAAGNQTEYSRAELADAYRLDLTAPLSDTPQSTGELGCDGIYYTGPVDITLRGRDPLSGVSRFHYQIDGGAWITVPVGTPGVPAGVEPDASPPFRLSENGRHVIDFRISDVAGNLQVGTSRETAYIDAAAPQSPIGLVVAPKDWARTNSFDVRWVNPIEESVVEAVHYKKGSPPTSNGDGVRLEGEGITEIPGMTVDLEGETSVFVWLEDSACNTSYETREVVVLRYDPTEPTTSIVTQGTEGANGFYVTPVAVTFGADDQPAGPTGASSSGVAQTRYRVNEDSQWRVWDGQPIVLAAEGWYTLTVSSIDHAGNVEWAHTKRIKIDLQPPSCGLGVASDYAGASTVGVSWTGSDRMSGIEMYWLEYSLGRCGPWKPWLSGIAASVTGSTFSGMNSQNYFYFFRIKARDRAGHVSGWSMPSSGGYAYREGLGNPSFELSGFGAWDRDGDLGVSLLDGLGHDGQPSRVARLSKERGIVEVPVDTYASVRQKVQLPPLDCSEGLLLSFWYQLQSYDVAWGLDVADGQMKWFDPFWIHVKDLDGRALATFLPDGNLTDNELWEPQRLWDPGWKHYGVDLTPWAGQQVWIEFAVWNKVDEQWPTWVYIDDVSLLPGPGRVARLPLIVLDAPPATLGAPAGLRGERPGASMAPVSAWHPGQKKPRK